MLTEVDGVEPGSVRDNSARTPMGAVDPDGRARSSASLSTAHLFERPDPDRADGPEDDRWAERNELWFGWGEAWDAE